MSAVSFLDELNDIQGRAVQSIDGPVMVIAGPGSGKTRVLTYRIAYMIEQGIAPFNILTLTFTNKAAKEMKERLTRVVGDRARHVWAGTFHAIFAKILRFEASKIGYPSSFTIYDTDDTKSMIGHIIGQMGLEKTLYVPNMVRNRISSAKSLLISPEGYRQNTELMEQDRSNKLPLLHEIYKVYVQRCAESSVMDFDDLLYNIFILFHRNPEGVLDKYREKFKYIMVDEFQDTNYLQYAILKKLIHYPGSPENICIVGDDAQSIYAFRGATIDNILDFKKDFPALKTFKLEQNYRSGKYIVNAANKVITNNQRQIKKEIWTDQAENSKIGLIRALTDAEEGRKVVDTIFEHKNRNHITNSEIAILYRTNAQSRVFEEHLRRANIPYRVFGGMSFYQRKEVKDLLAYFRLVINQQDEEAFRRVVNLPKRGIGDTSLEKLFAHARENNLRFWESIDHDVLPVRTQTMLVDFKKMIEKLSILAEKEPADVVANAAYNQSGIAAMLKADNTIEGKARTENINSLLNGVKEFVENDEAKAEETELDPGQTMIDYLQSISLIADADQEGETKDHINLMSVHAAKGLEFDSVFVVGLEENLFPSFMSIRSEAEIDEERRLFYVAITRARKLLTLSYATSRIQFGKVVYNAASRFLDEVGEENLLVPVHKVNNFAQESIPKSTLTGNFTRKQPVPGNSPIIDIIPSKPSAFKEGLKVLHPRFGKGVIKAIDGSNDNRIATIRFSSYDNEDRRIMLKFAKMQVLEG